MLILSLFFLSLIQIPLAVPSCSTKETGMAAYIPTLTSLTVDMGCEDSSQLHLQPLHPLWRQRRQQIKAGWCGTEASQAGSIPLAGSSLLPVQLCTPDKCCLWHVCRWGVLRSSNLPLLSHLWVSGLSGEQTTSRLGAVESFGGAGSTGISKRSEKKHGAIIWTKLSLTACAAGGLHSSNNQQSRWSSKLSAELPSFSARIDIPF